MGTVAASVPVSAEATDGVESALCDGEDFELLFTLAEDEYETLRRAWKFEAAISRVGTIVAGEGMRIIGGDGSVDVLRPKGYDHL